MHVSNYSSKKVYSVVDQKNSRVRWLFLINEHKNLLCKASNLNSSKKLSYMRMSALYLILNKESSAKNQLHFLNTLIRVKSYSKSFNQEFHHVKYYDDKRKQKFHLYFHLFSEILLAYHGIFFRFSS